MAVILNPLPPGGLDALQTLTALERRQLANLYRLPLSEIFGRVQVLLERFEKLARGIRRDSLLYSWLKAVKRWGKVVPFPPTPPPPSDFTFSGPTPSPLIRWPQIEAAVDSLMKRQVVTASDLAALDAQAQAAAYTVSRVHSVETLAAVRETVVRHVEKGGTLRQFQAEMADTLGRVLSPSQIEAEYRTQTGQAYGAGQRRVLENPIVGGEFPYVMWSATHDSRVRPDHLAMEKHGQNGSAVYRSDDPLWRTHWPPAAWNCRCIAVPLSLEDAARHGSNEARRWLRDGRPPVRPEFARQPYPLILPRGWVPTGAGISFAA